MLALLAQAASAAEWHDGWQLAVTTFTALTIVVGWLHRQSKSDLKSVRDDLSARITDVKDNLSTRITKVEADIARVEDKLSADIAEVHTDLKATRTELKGDIARAEDKLSADIAEVGGDLKDLKDNLLVDALKRARNPAAAPQLSEASPQQPPPQPKQLAETSTG